MSGRDDRLGIALTGRGCLNPTFLIGGGMTSGVDR